MQVRIHALALAALAVGTVAAVDPGGWAPFGPAKWLAVSTLGALAVGSTLLRAPGRSTRRIWWTWAGLIVLLTVAALTSGDVPTALLGHPDRHLGVLTWLLFWAMWCCGQRLRGDDVRVVAIGSSAAAAVLGGWSLWELLVGTPIDIATTSQRLTGPFGSAAYLGAAACVLGGVAAGVAFDRTMPTAARAVATFGATSTVVALVGSGARAAWFGAGAGVIVLLVAGRRRVGVRSALISAGAVVVACALIAPRLADVTQRTHGAASRLDEWRVAVHVIADHPLLGVGPEGYRIAASDGIDAGYERAYGRDDVLPDRAHSAPLDVALDGGIPAALLHLALVTMVVAAAVRRVRAPATSTCEVGIALAVVAYAAQQLLLFPLAELDPVWWLFAGVVLAAPATQERRRVPAVLGAVALGLAPLALVAGVLDVAADRLAQGALTTGGPAAITDVRRATQLRTDDVRYRIAAAVVGSRAGTLSGVDDALHQIHTALAWSPHDPILRDERASLLSQRAAITGSVDDTDAALRAWRQLVADDPNRARWQLQLGRAAAVAGDVDLARTAWTAAAHLAPRDPTALQLLERLDATSAGTP